MEALLKTGISLELAKKVEASDSAAAYGSGMVSVFATPAMIALMEKTCLQLVLPMLPEGSNTVGTEVNVRHLKATPLGMIVRCIATLIEIEGRKLVFELEVFDETGLIGEGTHTRFIIDVKRFMEKINLG